MKRQMSKTQKEPQARDWWNLGLNTITGFPVTERGKRDKETTENPVMVLSPKFHQSLACGSFCVLLICLFIFSVF